MLLLVFILACYGLTNILTYGKIFDKIRPKEHFFHCSMCVGFWVGMFNWFLVSPPFNLFVAGCISSGTSYILDKIICDEGIVIKNK